LLAATMADKRSVVTIRPDGSHLSVVIKGASSPSWSPDGSRIVVATDSGTYVSVRPDGTDAREVSFGDDDVQLAGEIALNQTGNLLAFFENLAPSSLPAPDSFDSSDAAWSPDETQLVFTSTSNSTRTSGDLWIVDANDGTLHLLARGMTGRPSWGPAN
jgi:Tol biopolymer transport system component